MKYLIDFLKSEGFLCLLVTFLVCAFFGRVDRFGRHPYHVDL